MQLSDPSSHFSEAEPAIQMDSNMPKIMIPHSLHPHSLHPVIVASDPSSHFLMLYPPFTDANGQWCATQHSDLDRNNMQQAINYAISTAILVLITVVDEKDRVNSWTAVSTMEATATELKLQCRQECAILEDLITSSQPLLVNMMVTPSHPDEVQRSKIHKNK